MFVRILSLIRLARVSRLVRFFNEVEKVSEHRTVLDTRLRNSINLSPTHRCLTRPGSDTVLHDNETQYIRTNIDVK